MRKEIAELAARANGQRQLDGNEFRRRLKAAGDEAERGKERDCGQHRAFIGKVAIYGFASVFSSMATRTAARLGARSAVEAAKQLTAMREAGELLPVLMFID
jgi:hypothetical protein